jgi:hypothetical protein
MMQQLEVRLSLANKDREARALLRAKEARPEGQSLRSAFAAWLARLAPQADREAAAHVLRKP